MDTLLKLLIVIKKRPHSETFQEKNHLGLTDIISSEFTNQPLKQSVCLSCLIFFAGVMLHQK